METMRDDIMDDKGYAFTPIAFLLTIPILIIAVSYGNIVDEINTISAIAIGGDVTADIASSLVNAVKLDAGDAGRNAAFLAVQSVINHYNLLPDNNPYFSKSGNTSRAFIIGNTVNMLNINVTNTARELEKQTGRDIYINGVYVNPDDNSTGNIFQSGDINIVQSDPWGFNITVNPIYITVVQNSSNYQNVTVKMPSQNVYVSIEKLEDPYIWVNTKARQSSLIWRYRQYTSDGNYHFADNVNGNQLNYLSTCLIGANATMGYRPYYFPDTHGLTFFDRLENRTNDTSLGPDSAKISTFILNDPLINEHANRPISTLDHEYFRGTVTGISIQTKKSGDVVDPTGRVFLISSNYTVYLNLDDGPY